MSEGGLKGEVELPGVGGVDKRVLLGIGGLLAAWVGWQYYRARQDAGAESVDPGFEDGGTLPGVDGAVKPGGDYGLPDGDGSTGGGSIDDYGFRGTTNSQWTQYAAAKLSSDDRWSYSTVVAALGAYLDQRPLTTAQQDIVRAALAVAGSPPVGYYVVVPGGDVPILVAPAGVRAYSVPGGVQVTWSSVAGAAKYEVTGPSTKTVTGTQAVFDGLAQGTSYSFTVRAVAAAGHKGPSSAAVSAVPRAPLVKPPPVATPSRPKVKPRTGPVFHKPPNPIIPPRN